MNTCIICRIEKDKKEFSDEHVIPDALGGYYHIYTVCKSCNSILGQKVDSKLTNHIFSKYQRNTLNLKGKSGKVPNPFDGTHIIKNDNNRKVRFEMDDKGIPMPYLLPEVEVEKEEDKTVIKISIDGDDKDKFNSILEKTLKRNGISTDTHKIDYDLDKHIKKFKPIIKMEHKLDVRDFKIGLLKIAYEFAVDKLPEYFVDQKAKDISNALLNADYGTAETFVLGSGFEKDIIEPLKCIFDFDSNKHYLILMSSNNGLLCYIKLSNLFEIIVHLSDKTYLENNLLFCINDLDNKEVKIGDLLTNINQIYSPMEYHFKHFSQSKNFVEKFDNMRYGIDFKFFKINNNLPLFDRYGNIVYNHIDEKIEQMMNSGKVKTMDDCIHKEYDIDLDEELYLKIVPMDKLIGIASIKAKNHIENKL